MWSAVSSSADVRPFEDIRTELIAEAAAWQAWVYSSFGSLHKHTRFIRRVPFYILHYDQQAPPTTGVDAISATKDFYNLINKDVPGMQLSDKDVPKPVCRDEAVTVVPYGFVAWRIPAELSAFFDICHVRVTTDRRRRFGSGAKTAGAPQNHGLGQGL